jgi:glycosyltransferase involved in cell wall biosynthesis
MTSTLVSLCMIVKDEEAALRTCLQSAAEVVNEIIVVDTGSTDGTLSVASQFGARVSTFDFREPDFSGARNQSLARARGEWVLVLDADEVLTATAATVIGELTSASDNIGYIAQRRNQRAPPAETQKDYVLRLFPNHPRHRYRGRVHETIDAAILANGGRIRTSHLLIEHRLPKESRVLAKSRFYLSILEQELAADPDNVDRLSFRRAELHKLGMLDEATRTAERIAVLAPNDPANHTSVGLYRFMHGDDPVGAERAFREALALNPNDVHALACLRSVRVVDAARHRPRDSLLDIDRAQASEAAPVRVAPATAAFR